MLLLLLVPICLIINSYWLLDKFSMDSSRRIELETLSSIQFRQQLEESRQKTAASSSYPRIILFSYVFGKQAADKRYLRVFLESARRSGVDVLIVGDHAPAPSSSLPPNVKYVMVTWDDLTDRVRDRILDGQEPFWMRHKVNLYKVIDFKPVFAHLFPELVQGYDFWGPVDNDLLLGDFRTMISQTLLSEYDIISPNDHIYTMGMHTLYRNTPVVNQLFRLTKDKQKVFNSMIPRFFDEYGGESTRKDRGVWLPYESTTAGIVEHHKDRLGIRWFGGVEHVFDGPCLGLYDGMCCECHLSPLPDGRQRLDKVCVKDNFRTEALLCHFQYTKPTVEESLKDDVRFGRILAQQGRFRINFLEGFMLEREC